MAKKAPTEDEIFECMNDLSTDVMATMKCMNWYTVDLKKDKSFELYRKPESSDNCDDLKLWYKGRPKSEEAMIEHLRKLCEEKLE